MTFDQSWKVACLILAVLASNQGARTADATGETPTRTMSLLRGHAHNDYEHVHPLLDALAQGFGSVEADIWLVDGQLLVAHDLADTKGDRTLQALYLDPLRDRIRQNGGRVFSNEASFCLLIDVKSAAEPTYAALRQLLTSYTNVLTAFTDTNTQTNALTIILSGNRALETVAAEPRRYVAIDGRFSDMKKFSSPQLIPLVSENWTQHFKWRGTGAFSEAEQIKLRELVDQVHGQGRRIRFWAVPDNLNGWRELASAGVDLINTDDLAGLAKFLQANRP